MTETEEIEWVIAYKNGCVNVLILIWWIDLHVKCDEELWILFLIIEWL